MVSVKEELECRVYRLWRYEGRKPERPESLKEECVLEEEVDETKTASCKPFRKPKAPNA